MSLFKCKMCGGDLEIVDGTSVAECEYCGTKQPVPKAMGENLQNLFNRANTLRIKSEFDKAEKLYEKIIQADPKQSEAYWGLILCKYGIEYVDDKVTYKKIPTCHRTSYDSIIADDDYKSALQYADPIQRGLYEEQAREIDRIQKDILALAQSEEPYDVFICYKETDANGKRTQDSVDANDMYYQLTQEGFKVFYAAITLEDKLGSAYEPIIFAALNSAKVMLAIGSKPEYFNAVWVKNEWSRFLKIIKKDRSKLLIPCYRDMDPYELPEEFAHLQAQNIAKLGAVNDIVRGIKKIIPKDEPKPAPVATTVVKETTVVSGGSPNTASLLERAFMFLEDGDWTSANEYCEKVLDIDPKNAQAYLAKLMADLHVKTKERLKNCDTPFNGNSNYQKVIRFADEKLKAEISGYVDYINTRNENARLEGIYSQAVSAMNKAKNETAYTEAATLFKRIRGYKDADALVNQCLEKADRCRENAEIARKDGILRSAKSKLKENTLESCNQAMGLLKSIQGWKDANEQMLLCVRKKRELETQAEADRLEEERLKELARIEEQKRERKYLTGCLIGIVAIVLAVALLVWGAIKLFTDILPGKKVDEFIEQYGQEVYDKYGLIEAGTTLTLGTYEQDNSTANGQEKIEWVVLEVKDGKALLISKYALDCKQFHENGETDVTWEDCTLRQWLNNEFFNAAFSEEEKAMIPTGTVPSDTNSYSGASSGDATQDKVFILSYTEAEQYFKSKKDRVCEATPYADANGALEYSGNCWWWLRTPGAVHADTVDQATYVSNHGQASEVGQPVEKEDIAVRPVIWIDLTA